MESSTWQTPPSPRVTKGQQLACRQCQRRKIKCDRKFPCGQCELSELMCQSSTRKKRSARQENPRTRKETNQGGGIRGRVARLERLVMETMQSEPAGQHEPTSSPKVTNTSENQALRTKYVAGDFWAALAGEFEALKDALDEDAELSDGNDLDIRSSRDSVSVQGTVADPLSGVDYILCPPGRIYQIPDALAYPDKATELYLSEIYITWIDAAWKIFHVPSLKAFLERDQPYIGVESAEPCNQALRAGILFAAIYQVSETDCQQKLQQSRSQLLEQLQRNAEACLIFADILATDKLATLQAFVIYVATLRKVDTSHRSWLLFPLVERLARALNVDKEAANDSFYIRELKRRVWHHLCILDTFFAMDRGSATIIHEGSFATHPPSNINDADFDEFTSAEQPIQNREGQITDMTSALTLHELCHIRHRQSGRRGEDWRERLNYVKACHESIHEKYLKYCDESIPVQRWLLKGTKIMRSMTLLDVVYPQQPIRGSSSSAPDEAFHLAQEVLRNSHDLWRDFELSKFRRLEWTQWHALAIILAGLCSSGSALGTDEAWYLVDSTLARSSEHLADSNASGGGKLWQPLRRLYNRALSLRNVGTPAPQGSSSSDLRTASSIPPHDVAQGPADAGYSARGGPLQDDTFVSDFWDDWASLFVDSSEIAGQGWQWLDLVN